MTLHELGIKYGTDKVDHNYLPIYDKLFTPLRNEIISLLEIGIYKGASLRMWADYFHNGYIYGIDKDVEACQCVSELSGVVAINADVIEYKFKDHLFDIVIDDGSHLPTEQIAAFGRLYSLLKPGGYYIIEDIYTQHFGDRFYEYQKRFIDVAYLCGGSVTYHNTLTIIQKSKDDGSDPR